MVSMKRVNYIISIITLIIGMIIMSLAIELGIGTSKKYGIKSGTWPFMIGIMIVSCAIILLIATIIKKKNLEDEKTILILSPNKRVYLVALCMVISCALLKFLGLYIMGIIMLPTVMWIMEERDKKLIILTTVGALLLVFIVFELLLKSKMPTPFWT